MLLRLEFNDGQCPIGIILKPDFSVGMVGFDPISNAKRFFVEPSVRMH